MEDRTASGRRLYELGLELGRLGAVAIGSGGGSLARVLARAAGCGVALAGGEAKFHDGSCAACGVWLARYYGLPASLFIRQEGAEVTLYVRDGAGRPLIPGQTRGAGQPCTGEWDLIAGADCAWAANRAGQALPLGPAAAAGPAALILLLERLGYDVVSSSGPGLPCFRADREGFRLEVTVGCRVYCPTGPDALAAAASFAAEPQAVPAFGTDEELL